jgi:NAD(P)-dependent dehydrogenase (short-subunit alcohol dehydrogenase family)
VTPADPARATPDPLVDLSGRVALVTGGSRGLGRSICLGLAARGADVVVASRNLQACEEVAADVRELGRRALPIACHVGRWEELDALVDAAYAEFGRIDVLVNNAGKSPRYGDLTDITFEQWSSVVHLNLSGVFRLSSLVGSRMYDAGRGSIINISSAAATRPTATTVPYAAAKAGVNALTVGMAEAYAPTVRVNCVAPGPFATDISRAWTPEVWSAMTDGVVLGRVGEPDEILGAVVYLAGDASAFTTGTVLRVDGGMR